MPAVSAMKISSAFAAASNSSEKNAIWRCTPVKRAHSMVRAAASAGIITGMGMRKPV